MATAIAPARIQRRRTAGWKKPDGAVNCTRGSVWGNPWKEGVTGWTVLPGGWIDRTGKGPLTRRQAIDNYRNSKTHDIEYLRQIREQLVGKTLMCWCRLDQPCHVDWLLEVANSSLPLESYLDRSPQPVGLPEAAGSTLACHVASA
ncbi:DUF4326 domain-containing protein [Streptomyces sp. AC1-42T]|uniref:DUF4326 domain-containing protein n=1 Tax=Streptomyces sp. AC1-42T TaxID=2218665 RepID=UPI000DAB51E7|nr:DUF4326 domain-containing protein [Streptomyces sp. AC1-42T]PZT71456.1 hypothetical protein DNK55_32600 [Streptomyces sp. AC1-42T]